MGGFVSEAYFSGRTFEIWNREKFLTKEQGKTILKRCGLEIEFFNYYETAEPLSYYSHTRITPQNLLILENKDTFYSMRRHLLNGNKQIFGRDMGTLIYGEGKRILKSFEDLEFCVEPYMTDSGNTIYYFGDLDYEGIGIHENLAKNFQMNWKIRPFVPAYQEMLSKAEHVGMYVILVQNSIQKTTWKQYPVIGISNVQIKLYKIEEQREYPITWAEVAKNSGGEGFLSAFVILECLTSIKAVDGYGKESQYPVNLFNRAWWRIYL